MTSPLNLNSPCACITIEPGFQLLRLRDLFFGIPLLFLDLTLPPASPPISPGLQKFLLAFSRSRASRGVLNRPLDTKHSITERPRKTWRHTVRGVQKLNSEFLNRPLDTKNSITKRPRKTSRHHRSQRSELENRIPKPTSGHLERVCNSRRRREVEMKKQRAT